MFLCEITVKMERQILDCLSIFLLFFVLFQIFSVIIQLTVQFFHEHQETIEQKVKLPQVAYINITKKD